MRRTLMTLFACILLAPALLPAETASGLTSGKPAIQSMSALTFGPKGILFIGDGKAGAVHAVDLGDRTARESDEALAIEDLEARIAALLGARPDQIMIHDMAVNPISQNVYLAVSRGRSQWDSAWKLPNDIADATILLKVAPDKTISAVSLDDVPHARATLPNPVDASKTHVWKKEISLRADTITDMAYMAGVVYVAGLSNEEFASTMWKIPYPFGPKATTTTLEIFHGAHGEYETHAPIRTFLPYKLGDESYLLASYLCTPLVTFRLEDLTDGKHLKGRTIAEFGYGNYPLDMVVYSNGGKERLLIANSNLPMMIVKPEDIRSFEGSITQEVSGYTAGVPYEIRSGVGIQQMDKLNEKIILTLRRLPSGTMSLESFPVQRF